MTDHANLAAALVAFQNEMPTVAKSKTANVPMKSGGSYSYKYADLADVMAAAVPILTRCGLAFSARPRRTDAGDYELAGVLTHTSGEEKEGALPIFGRSPQEIGSSITYGRRYLLGCLTGIVTDDDDDAQTAQAAPARTRRQPTADEVLSTARMAAYQTWTGKHPNANQADFPAAFEADMAIPFADATAVDFDIFATHTREQ